jgi:tRNA(Ile)-lysidine synthase TilS/MesJ
MQQELFTNYIDYSNQKVLIGLSGGINSMAVLCCLALYPDELKPKELHLFYAHFDEH